MREKLIELIFSTPKELTIGRRNGKSFMAVANIADHLIANGVTVQEWISVKDRLPEEDGRYLCNVKSFAFPGCFYQAILQCDKNGFREGNIYTDDVTHWMPLPQPPKGE